MIRFFIVLTLLMTVTHASENRGFETRKEWVRLLREFSLEMEKSSIGKILTFEQKSYLEKFEIFASAWADSRYDCLYAGWPSVLKTHGGKKLCTNPANANSSYNKSECKSNELQCQPLLFGKGLCVSFVTKTEKQTSFSRCDQKFKSEKRDEEFLKSPEFTSANASDLRELSTLAATICDPSSSSPQRTTPMCQKIMKHLDPKGRNETQLEILRQDLPGSVIFNYSGPNMKSKFF